MAECPTCEGTGKAPRCDSTQGAWLCQRDLGHDGPHMAFLEGDTALRWGMVGRGCFDPECVRTPGHPMPHNNGNGKSWVPTEWPTETATSSLTSDGGPS